MPIGPFSNRFRKRLDLLGLTAALYAGLAICVGDYGGWGGGDLVTSLLGSIEAYVTDAVTKVGVSGATVTANPGNHKVTADGDGYYALTSVEAGDYAVTASKAGYQTTTVHLALAPVSLGTTYYVRPDGGTSEQCTGVVDAPYPGSGMGRPCALSHPFWLFPPGGTPLLKGGDRLIVAAGSYRMGIGAPNTGSCSSYWPWDCYMPPVPSGPDSEHPTRIVGAGWNNGCSQPPELFGVERASMVLNLDSSNHVQVECLEITDHSSCVESHPGVLTCQRDNYPYGDWAPTGIFAKDSRDVVLKNLNVHGLANQGVQAGRLRDWLVEDVRVAGNGWAGWNGDLSPDDVSGNTGMMTFRRFRVEWNGCGETYPGGEPTGCWGQTAGGYGDGFGTGATGGDWVFEDSEFLHNTSDGLDMLYHRLGGTVTLRRCRAEGNAGNQIKSSGNTSISNSVAIGNCGYFQDKPFTYSTDQCRALGNAISLEYATGSKVEIVNTSVYSEGDCLLIATGQACIGTEKLISRNNIFVAGTDFLQSFENSALFYSECAGLNFDNDYSIIYNTKDVVCPLGSHDVCSDPLIGPFSGDAINMIPASGSPAIDTGLGVGVYNSFTVPDYDLRSYVRPFGSQVDRGAYEVGSGPPGLLGHLIITAVNVTAPWTLTGPNSFSQTGTGDQALTNLAPGDYTLTWGNVAGWTKPSPATSTQTLTAGGTITFTGTYRKVGLPWLLLLLGN